ncbi:MAG: response regulator [Candidatus Lloydbacteria bacterium]|nr:response regulator [Candidatus Lloydbacteria bacterium]
MITDDSTIGERKQKVFIVDDDTFLLDMYVIKFNEVGFEVCSAGSGIDALDKLNDGFIPDLMLLDVVMPGMDGFELLKNIKEKNLAPSAKIIILSNIGQENDIERGKKLGANGYIVKASVTPTEVVEKMKEMLKQK